jgi:hypothetical protein
LVEDVFWAARQAMHFTHDNIHTLVATGQYTDATTERHMTDSLVRRRDATGKAYLACPVQLDRFQVVERRVMYDDLAVKHSLLPPQRYSHAWFKFDNTSGEKRRIAGAITTDVPRSGAPYLRSKIKPLDTAGNESSRVTIYLRQVSGVFNLAGIDRASN